MADEEERREEEFASRQLLQQADSTVILVDRQLERLKRAAELYRQRLQGRARHVDE
jgi:Flp pilus assembly CpaE family ATPase